MYIFVIDSKNRVTPHSSTDKLVLGKGECTFANARELADLLAGWPGTRHVEIWNKLPNTKNVSRFTDRRTATQRIWRAVQALPPPLAQDRAPSAGIRDATKTDLIIALLKRPSGATLKDIMAQTGWQAHSVRGFISGQLSRRLGFCIKSFKPSGERVYRIVKGESREHRAL